jgi:hypothetical protein
MDEQNIDCGWKRLSRASRLTAISRLHYTLRNYRVRRVMNDIFRLCSPTPTFFMSRCVHGGLGFTRGLALPPIARLRIAAGFLAAIFFLTGCVSFLHHHHDLQGSTPCPICYAIHAPALVGSALEVPQLTLMAFYQSVQVQISWAEASSSDCPPRAPPAA